MLFEVASNNSARREFIEQVEAGNLLLPDGCFVNYDVTAIDFLRELISTRIDSQLEIYRGLKESLDRRPSLSEFYMGGGAVTTVRNAHDQWLAFVMSEGDLNKQEQVDRLYLMLHRVTLTIIQINTPNFYLL